MELLIRNAVTVNLETGEENKVSVGIDGGEITTVIMENEKTLDMEAADRILDAEGAYLLPDMMDFHTHLFTGGSGFGVNGDLLLPSGATMAVDMGSAGTIGYEAFRMMDILPRTIRIKSFLNLSPLGQPGTGFAEPLGSSAVQLERMKELAEKYPEEICGIKVRISRELVGSEGLAPLERAIDAGNELGLPVCVHTTNPPAEASEIVRRLRSGDIYSHVYHGKGNTILNEAGKVQREFFEAKKRGVYLEVGNGRMNFNFQVAEAALKEGIFPDIISSDATVRTFANEPDMKDLTFVMSKFWNMGMPLHKVFDAVTRNPAKAAGISEECGVLRTCTSANLTLLRPAGQETVFTDSSGNRRNGDRILIPEMTMIRGRIVYLQGRTKLYRMR